MTELTRLQSTTHWWKQYPYISNRTKVICFYVNSCMSENVAKLHVVVGDSWSVLAGRTDCCNMCPQIVSPKKFKIMHRSCLFWGSAELWGPTTSIWFRTRGVKLSSVQSSSNPSNPSESESELSSLEWKKNSQPIVVTCLWSLFRI